MKVEGSSQNVLINNNEKPVVDTEKQKQNFSDILANELEDKVGTLGSGDGQKRPTV